MALQILLLLRPSVCITVIPWIEYKWQPGCTCPISVLVSLETTFKSVTNAVHEDVIMFFVCLMCTANGNDLLRMENIFLHPSHPSTIVSCQLLCVGATTLQSPHEPSKQCSWLYNV